jgi:hypothetical protein
MARWYYNEETKHWDLTEEEYLKRKPVPESSGVTVIYGKSFGLPPGEKIKRENNARKNLERDPLYTDYDDYKPKVEAFRDRMNEMVELSNTGK